MQYIDRTWKVWSHHIYIRFCKDGYLGCLGGLVPPDIVITFKKFLFLEIKNVEP